VVRLQLGQRRRSGGVRRRTERPAGSPGAKRWCKVPATELREGEDEVAARSPVGGASVETNNGFTILVVDDNHDLVTSTAGLLELAGYSAIGAYSAREAVDLLDNEKIDLVLSDIRMPGIDGFDLLRVLRHRFPALPMVLMSGLPVTLDDVVPRGATILMKPFSESALRESIARKLAAPPYADGSRSP
jgi:CheY-like chemotaxis protein